MTQKLLRQLIGKFVEYKIIFAIKTKIGLNMSFIKAIKELCNVRLCLNVKTILKTSSANFVIFIKDSYFLVNQKSKNLNVNVLYRMVICGGNSY